MGVTAREPPAAREKACATIISRLGAPAGGNSRHRVEMAEDQVASAQLLRNFAPLDAMKRENLAALAKKVSVRTLSAGRVLFNQGDTDKRTVWLVSGAVEVNENERNIGVLRAGTPETRNPLYPKLPRRVTVRAVDDITFLSIESDLLDVMITWDQTGTYEVEEGDVVRSEEHTSQLQSQSNLVCRLLL